MRILGENEVERRKLLAKNKTVEAECIALREENYKLKNAKTSMDKHLKFLD